MKFLFNISATIKLVALTVICAVSLGASQADLKVVETSSTDMSKLLINGQPPTDQQKAMFQRMPMFQAGGTAMTLYLKGSKTRVESAQFTFLGDYAAKTMTSVDNAEKTYWTKSLSDFESSAAQKDIQFDVKDMGTTQQILGYTCEGYDVTVTSHKMNMDFQLWTATGLFELPEGLATGNSWLDAFKNKIKGFPLKTVMSMNNPMFGQVTSTTVVTSISKDGLPDSLFSPPADYKQVDPPSASSRMNMSTPPRQ